MASDIEFVTYVVDQCDPDLEVTQKKMFGEYGLWSRGKFVGAICDNTVFVKPTAGGRAHMGEVVEGPPYPGAKPALVVGDRVDDAAWLSALIRITAAELPEPKPRKRGRK